MPYTLFVASDVFGRKTNLELEFPFAPTLAELTKQTEYAFTQEQNAQRPGHNVPYQVAKFHVVDEITDDWVEVLGANQLRNFCQLYAFQPHSTRYTESQGHIPPAKKGVMSYEMGQMSHSPPHHRPGPGWNSQSPGRSPGYQSVGRAGSLPAGVKGFPDNVGHDEKVKLTFEEIDANKNRVLENDEVQRTFRLCGLDFTTPTLDDLFRKADHDKDGVVNWAEWQRFAELYPALLDSLYYRLKAHWEHLAETGRIDSIKAQRPSLEERERAAQQALDNLNSETDDLARRQADADAKVSGAQDAQRAAEDAARDGMRDVERARQAKADKDREHQAERERERQAQLRAQESAREMDEANRRAQAAQQGVDAADAAERRAMQALQDAQREKERQQELADAAKRDAAAAQDRHNQILGDIPRNLEHARQLLADAERDLALADQRQRELAQKAHELQGRVGEAQRMRDELARQLQAARERNDPFIRALSDAKGAISDHDRQIADLEERLAQEDARKKQLLDEEKNIVEQEVKLREQRESLEEKEGALRSAHSNFFHNAGRQSPGRSRSPAYHTPTKY